MNLLIIKRFWRNAHAPYRVTERRGFTNDDKYVVISLTLVRYQIFYITLHVWNIRPHIAYSLCNFQWAAVTIKGSLLMNLTIIKRFGAMRMRRVTLPKVGGSQITTYLESRPNIAYSLCNFQGAAVTIKAGLLMKLPIIKRFWRNAPAPCHVTQGRGVINNHIFGIPDPILPIHFALSGGCGDD